VFCSPCVHEIERPPCNGNNICMQRITPGPVIESVLRLVGSDSQDKPAPAPGRVVRFPTVTETSDGTPLGVVVRESLKGANPS